MGLGTSLVLIAVGAVLAYAVDTAVAGIDIATIGVILMIVGAVGVLLSTVLLASPTTRDVISREQVRRH